MGSKVKYYVKIVSKLLLIRRNININVSEIYLLNNVKLFPSKLLETYYISFTINSIT